MRAGAWAGVVGGWSVDEFDACCVLMLVVAKVPKHHNILRRVGGGVAPHKDASAYLIPCYVTGRAKRNSPACLKIIRRRSSNALGAAALRGPPAT